MSGLTHFVSIFAIMIGIAPTEAQDSTATFYRGINLNGPALVIDGHQWEAGDAENVHCNASAFENADIPLKPATDPNRARMIRSSRWGQEIDVELRSVPSGVYQVFLYNWEDNDSERFFVKLNGKMVLPDHNSGNAGEWKRLGPWRIVIRDGNLKISAGGGAANLSGLEVWSGDGSVPDPREAEFASMPTDEQLAFFESRIRPLLIDNCYACHSQDADEPGGSLLLDSRAGVIRGGFNGPLMIPGDPDSSLMMQAVRQVKADLKMPPEGRLTEEQIADLESWIRMKAPDPRSEDTVAAVRAKTAIDWNKARGFWSLKPITQPSPPVVADGAWPKNEIDTFILSKIEAAGLAPAEDAEKRTLIRRATFDLIGLPPSPEEVREFAADESPDAFAKVIDRLLSSRQYGERWGRYWLDVVRYSDTAGDNSDFPIPQMYLYRNWVIDAFNNDLPYDQFVREQLAGDLLDSSTPDEKRNLLIATGYIANARRFGSRVDDYPTHLTIEDTLDNLGRTFLATTVNCARCHNHKFDPIPTEDYYALYGIFHSTRYPWPGIELEQRQRDFVALASLEEVAHVQQDRSAGQQKLDAEVKRLKKDRDDAEGDARKALDAELDKAEDAARVYGQQPLPYETLYAVAEASTIEDVSVHLKGDPSKAGDLVPRRFLSMLNGDSLPSADPTSGRLQLANWITDRSNPLTARVIVNRIWLYHFGKGLVPTPNDFGRQGKAPTHPELLDWLAQRFMDTGWSIKSLNRTIVLSRTYQQASILSAAAVEQDPTNEWLSAFPRRRLDAEALRDTLLLLGGNLDPTPGGPHPFPPQHEWKFTQHYPFKAVYETNRRSVYLMTQRIQRHPYLAIFDGADPSVSTPIRMTSTTPLQALYLLNDKFVHEQADGLMKRILRVHIDARSRLELVWSLLFSRPPMPEEVQASESFLNSVRNELAQTGMENNQLERESWMSLIRSLVRTNEFVYVD